MQSTTSSKTSSGVPFLTQVTQGIMLGTVLAVPVALWAYTQAQPQSIAAEEPAVAPAKTAKRIPGRKPMRVKEAQTIPASQMHVRIDRGNGSAPVASAVADN
jgi:hypothetical protein